MAVIIKDCYQYQVKKTNTNLKKCCFAPHLSQEQPKKVCFKYDLVFNPECELPVDHLRCEKLTFNNPSKDFKRKLIKAGGVRLPDNMTDCIQSTTMWCTVILILILIFGVYTVLTVWQCLKDSWWKNLIYFLISDNSWSRFNWDCKTARFRLPDAPSEEDQDLSYVRGSLTCQYKSIVTNLVDFFSVKDFVIVLNHQIIKWIKNISQTKWGKK